MTPVRNSQANAPSRMNARRLLPMGRTALMSLVLTSVISQFLSNRRSPVAHKRVRRPATGEREQRRTAAQPHGHRHANRARPLCITHAVHASPDEHDGDGQRHYTAEDDCSIHTPLHRLKIPTPIATINAYSAHEPVRTRNGRGNRLMFLRLTGQARGTPCTVSASASRCERYATPKAMPGAA